MIFIRYTIPKYKIISSCKSILKFRYFFFFFFFLLFFIVESFIEKCQCVRGIRCIDRANRRSRYFPTSNKSRNAVDYFKLGCVTSMTLFRRSEVMLLWYNGIQRYCRAAQSTETICSDSSDTSRTQGYVHNGVCLSRALHGT